MHELMHQIQTYGPPGIIIIAALDSMGVPLPAVMDALLIGIAAASTGSSSVAWFSALLAVIGSTAGNWILFHAARQGRKLVSKPPIPGAKPGRFREWFRQYGLLTVFIPAVTPVLPLPLKVFVISAGCMHTSTGRFITTIVAARTIRYFGVTYLGLQLGADAQGFLIRNGWTLTGIALAIALALTLVIRSAGKRGQTAQ